MSLDKLRGMIDTLPDITEVQRAKMTLEAVLETSGDGFWDWNVVDNTEYLSPKFKMQLGYLDSEMENSPDAWQDLIFPEDMKEMFAEVQKHFESGGRHEVKVVCRYRHKKGHEVIILCRGAVIEWGTQGEPLRMVGTHIDITDLV